MIVRISGQRLEECLPLPRGFLLFRHRFVVSTSKFGIGQREGPYRTPLGLHCVARKMGRGQSLGSAFKGRRVVGTTRQGMPQATICHRILWLRGLQPGFNRGGSVDSFARFIYIHDFGDETTLGPPASHGCVHVAASDLMPLFDRTPVGTLVWIER